MLPMFQKNQRSRQNPLILYGVDISVNVFICYLCPEDDHLKCANSLRSKYFCQWVFYVTFEYTFAFEYKAISAVHNIPRNARYSSSGPLKLV